MVWHWPEFYVELICEEELLLPELLVFWPLVALGCRCTRWPEASRLFSPWLAPALLRTADTKQGNKSEEEETDVKLLWLLLHMFQARYFQKKWKWRRQTKNIQMNFTHRQGNCNVNIPAHNNHKVTRKWFQQLSILCLKRRNKHLINK